MPVLTSERKKPKRSKIRYAEYYDLQKTLDSLYADIHQLVHATDEKTISRLLQTLRLDDQQRNKLNKLRKQANLNAI